MDKKLYPRIGEEVIWETLDNGLPVCIVPKQGFSRKYALFATRYGGMDMRFELKGQWLDTPAGIAHYLEHKMFDTKDGNALQELAKNGAEPNAFTSNAITCYYFDSTEKFYENLEILLSFVSVPYFTDESVEKEQGIIGQEIGMIEDNPEWQVYKQMMQALYRSSPARTPVAGSVESISHITAQTLYDCHKAFYTPANMCLVVVGDVDPETVLATAKRVLPAESGAIIRRDYGAEESTDTACGYAEAQMEVAMPTFLVGFKCPPQHGGEAQHRFAAIGELACDVLMGESSPLYARLYSQGLINGSFGAAFDLLPGAAYAYAGGDSKDPKAVAEAILDEAQPPGAGGPPPLGRRGLRRVRQLPGTAGLCHVAGGGDQRRRRPRHGRAGGRGAPGTGERDGAAGGGGGRARGAGGWGGGLRALPGRGSTSPSSCGPPSLLPMPRVRPSVRRWPWPGLSRPCAGWSWASNG